MILFFSCLDARKETKESQELSKVVAAHQELIALHALSVNGRDSTYQSLPLVKAPSLDINYPVCVQSYRILRLLDFSVLRLSDTSLSP